jgi:hypothetical protein
MESGDCASPWALRFDAAEPDRLSWLGSGDRAVQREWTRERV